MKTFFSLTIIICLLMSCKTTKSHDACREETTSVIFKPVVLPVDSGEVKAKIIMPERGVFALSDIRVKATERMDMSISLDSAGNIAVKSATRPDTIAGSKEITSVTTTETKRSKDNSYLLYVFLAVWALLIVKKLRS